MTWIFDPVIMNTTEVEQAQIKAAEGRMEYKLESSDAYLTDDDYRVMVIVTRAEMSTAVVQVENNHSRLLALFTNPFHAREYIAELEYNKGRWGDG